jgi:hypothetical protein
VAMETAFAAVLVTLFGAALAAVRIISNRRQ